MRKYFIKGLENTPEQKNKEDKDLEDYIRSLSLRIPKWIRLFPSQRKEVSKIITSEIVELCDFLSSRNMDSYDYTEFLMFTKRWAGGWREEEILKDEVKDRVFSNVKIGEKTFKLYKNSDIIPLCPNTFNNLNRLSFYEGFYSNIDFVVEKVGRYIFIVEKVLLKTLRLNKVENDLRSIIKNEK